jgi:hypothetical protein
MKKYSVAILSIAASAIAQASSSNFEIKVDSNIADESLIDEILSQNGLAERAPALAIHSAMESLASHLTFDGMNIIDIEAAQKFAYNNHDSGDSNGTTGSAAYTCYGNCHSACHGSRAWR